MQSVRGNVQNSTVRRGYIVSYDALERMLETSISSFIDLISIYGSQVLETRDPKSKTDLILYLEI